MAFDKKRLQTFDWLHSLADHKAAYCTNYGYVHDVCVYCGQIYATNDIVLACVEYPEFYHLSDYEWSSITAYKDENGLLLETPEIETRERQYKNNRIFKDMFINQWSRFECKVDYRVMADALKPFKINRINPNLVTCENRIELLGHNDDISIRVLIMGMR